MSSMTTYLHEERLLQGLRIRQSSTVATLVLLVYEWIIISRTEFRYIWRHPFKLNQVIYLFSRYFGIAVQSVNTYLVLGPYSSLSNEESACRKWQLFQALASYTLSGALHLILMLMVYALHLKDLRVGIFLILLYFSQIALQVFVTPKTVFHVEYDPLCDTRTAHRDIIYIVISIWVNYISLIILTAVKKNLVALGAPVVKRIIRDGAWTIILLCSIFTAILSYALVHQVVQGHLFGWSSTILSITCCRIIINMETLDYIEPEHEYAVGLNTLDNLQLVHLERERRGLEGLGMESRRNA